uniref:Small ribosomal subunit protein mS26 n=1 Tax=Callorhinchus milii TaxID=7868 RepID=A0A4W3IHK4_CALMI|eukprot:gi/632976539/ref/XP_007904852.1/ PREDICTED: 28S ribosomal protein S26, mitochondrial [Callorhinchus milii]
MWLWSRGLSRGLLRSQGVMARPLQPTRGRKSRTDPPARSKAERRRVPTLVCPRELLVLRERYSQYTAIVGALRGEFKEAMLRQRYEEEVGSLAEERKRAETEEHRYLMAMNDAENQRLRGLREERLRQEAEEELRQKMDIMLRREEKREVFLQERVQEILKLQEEVKNFITLENVDQRIEAALDNPQNYNFAIDQDGRVVKRTVKQ